MINRNDLIDARELSNILVKEKNFTRWIKRKIIQDELKIDKDYFIEKINVETLKGISREKVKYYLTIEACEKIILSQSKSRVASELKEQMANGLELTEIINKIEQNQLYKVKIIKYEDEEYPEELRKIKNSPNQLYVKGNIQNLNEHGIAVIGTRHCSNYGRRICKIFTKNLVGYNLNIISGLAIGIDACAHKACIEEKGKTIAVLPSGFDNIYPKENEELLNKILENGGTVITEYPPEFEKTSESCRERNRIVSGLSIGILVIEAGKYSGTTKTVRHAKEQGKKTFCIPASLLNSKGIGTNKMIRENNAQMATEVEDIIKEFPELKLERKSDFDFMKVINKKTTKEKTKETKINLKIEEENLEIYNFLTKEPKTINEIAQDLGKPLNEITYKLTLLELQGAIEELPGKKFKIK